MSLRKGVRNAVVIEAVVIALILAGIHIARGQTWHIGSQATVSWDAVTMLIENGTQVPLPAGESIEYTAWLVNTLTDPGKTNPILFQQGISTTQLLMLFADEGRYVIGVQAVRKSSNGIEISRSTISWSDDPAAAIQPFGVWRLPDNTHSIPDSNAYGYLSKIPGGDTTHKDGVYYVFDGRSGEVVVNYDVWDTDVDDEGEIWLNGELLANMPKSGNEVWKNGQSIILPDDKVFNDQPNILMFKNANNPPNAWPWGVRNVSFDAPIAAPMPVRGLRIITG